VLNSSLTMFREKAIKHNFKLSVDIAAAADTEIEADQRKIKQIVFNLLGNGVKFALDHGSVSLSAAMLPE
jgi:signal transduction histidine kinase